MASKSTFSLTQVKLSSLGTQLPPLHDGQLSTRGNKTTRGMLSSRSEQLEVKQATSQSSSPRAETHSTFRLSDKVASIDEVIKARVARLFSTNREELLPRMVKVERSAHVKAQLLALERFVHALRQKYDALVTERRQRQRDLYRSNEVFALLLKAQAGTGSEGRLRDVEKRCEDTDTLLERELLYTETLDHMLGTMKKCILAAALPTQPMLRQLTRARIANGVENCDVGVTEHDVERLRSEVKSLKKAFVMQHTKHSAATQAMLERYSYQKEFVVLCEEQQKQFVIRDSIAELQEEERRALGLLREAKSVEEMKRHADELTEQAQKQKEALGQLFQVARLQNADDIINYFQFLRESANTLDATRATLEERIASLRLSLLEATAEFKAAAETSVVSVPGFNRVDSLEAEVKAAERGEEARIEKVRWLQKECGCMQELLLDLLQRTDFAQKPLDGLDVPSLLTLLQTSLLKLQEEIAPETHRTAATDESELA